MQINRTIHSELSQTHNAHYKMYNYYITKFIMCVNIVSPHGFGNAMYLEKYWSKEVLNFTINYFICTCSCQ